MYLFVLADSGNYTRYMVNKVPGENSYFMLWTVHQATQYLQLEIIMPGDIVDGYGDIMLSTNPPLTATDYLLYAAGIILGLIIALAILSFVWRAI
jgi:cytochrome c-type biogenesis protein CcmH/NrfF